MFAEYDRVLYKPKHKACLITDIDEGVDEKTGIPGVIYLLEAEDQNDPEWFYWAEEDELEKLPKY